MTKSQVRDGLEERNLNGQLRIFGKIKINLKKNKNINELFNIITMNYFYIGDVSTS